MVTLVVKLHINFIMCIVCNAIIIQIIFQTDKNKTVHMFQGKKEKKELFTLPTVKTQLKVYQKKNTRISQIYING